MQATVKVLLVDDGPDLRPMMEEALGQRGIVMLVARSGGEAVEWIERDPPHLVVCDVYVPDVDGYQICERVRAHPRLSETPVLLMADVVDRTVLARAARVGANGVVRKPCLADELMSGIEGHLREILEGRAIVDRNVELGPVATDSRDLLVTLTSEPGVCGALLVDRDGFVVEWSGEPSFDAEAIAALASGVLEASASVGREVGQGALQSMTCEFERGLVLLVRAESSSAVAIVLRDRDALETARPRAIQIAMMLSHSIEMQAVTPLP